MRRVSLAFTLVACGSSPTALNEPTPVAPTDAAAPDVPLTPPAPQEPPVPLEAVPVLIQELRQAASIDTILWRVFQNEGWPLRSDASVLFVRPDDGSGPYALAGDHNAWVPSAMHAEPGFFWFLVARPEVALWRYKYVDIAGDGVYAADPWARRYAFDEHGELSIVESPGAYLERFWLGSDDNRYARLVRVWVPIEPPTHHLYAQDGQNLFDPLAFWGGWHLQEALGPSTLAIGLDNSPARMDEYTHTKDLLDDTWIGGDAAGYIDYIEQVVRTFIENRYGEPAVRGLIGSSLGGLVSLYHAYRFPADYDFAASMSGTIGWGSFGTDSDTILDLFLSRPPLPFTVYLDSGGAPGSGCTDVDGDGVEDDQDDSDNYCVSRQMADALAGSGYVWDETLWHWWEPDAPHNEAAWRARVFRPIEIFEALR